MEQALSTPTPCSPVSEPPASMHASRIRSASSFARSTSPSAALSYRTRGWRLPSPAWKTLPTRRPYSSAERLDLLQHRGESRARNDPVLHVVVGRDPPNRGKRPLAALPQQRALRLVACDAELEGPGGMADLLHGLWRRLRPARRRRRARRAARSRRLRDTQGGRQPLPPRSSADPSSRWPRGSHRLR